MITVCQQANMKQLPVSLITMITSHLALQDGNSFKSSGTSLYQPPCGEELTLLEPSL